MLSDRTDRKRSSPWFYALMLLILILVFSKSKAQTDSLKMPPDSINLVCMKDFTEFYTWLGNNLSKSAYDKLTPEQTLGEFARWAILRYNKKKNGH
jgi:hypothetical protein